MQFIREKNFEVAFLNMVNKLAFTKKVLLQPLLASLKDINQEAPLARIHKLEAALEDNFDPSPINWTQLSRTFVDYRRIAL